MDFLKGMDIAASGLSAEKFRMNIIANNIANANTAGYKKQDVIFETVMRENTDNNSDVPAGGVRVSGIVEDPSDFNWVYDPDNPQAIKDKTNEKYGYVPMSNVKVWLELVNLITAQRAYEANLSTLSALHSIDQQALEIGRR